MAGTQKKEKARGVRLNIELGSQLLLKFPESKDFFPTYLLGLKSDAFIIIKTPTVIGNAYRLSEGKAVSLRYAHLGEVFRFQSTVLRSIKRPFKVTFLSYPKTIERLELRNSKRASCYIPASLIHDKGEIEGVITDISRGGSQFTTSDIRQAEAIQFKIGDPLLIHFPVLAIEDVKQISGQMKTVNKDSHCAHFGIGFIGIDDPLLDKIGAYVERIQQYAGKAC